MDQNVFYFFDGKPKALPLYEAFEERVFSEVEPYPGRFTHHVLISGAGEIDDELMGWVKEAAVFSAGKR